MKKYFVKIYDENEELVSADVWYGYSIENVKFWVDLAIRKMIDEMSYTGLRYEINSM